MKNKEVRTRFAPSPTGYVHVGNLRTALYAYLLAKKYDGKFLLRVEDTDQKRKVEGSLERIIEALNWAGLIVDEGVTLDKDLEIVEEGEYGPYFQSKRLDIYRKYVDELIEKGYAYYCFCSSERLDDLRKEQQARKEAPMYDKKCLSLSREDVERRIADGESYVIRMNVPAGETIEFEDLVYGKIKINSSTVDDQVILKSDGFPTYHLAVVVDDYLMKITHIVRGEDWLPSAPKHVLLYKFLGWEAPKFLHVPNVLNENRKKLSKRQGDVSVDDFIAKGYLPETIVNFLALLGWNPKSEQEYFTLNDLIKVFDEKGLHKAGAVFDYKKLDWMNAHYIKEKSEKELFDLCSDYFNIYTKENKIDFDESLFKKILFVEKDRVKKISDIVENIDFYFGIKILDEELIRWKDTQNLEMFKRLEKVENLFEKLEFKSVDEIKDALMDLAGDKRGEFLHPTRTALSGQKNSPSPFEIAWVLGKVESLNRIKKAKKMFA